MTTFLLERDIQVEYVEARLANLSPTTPPAGVIHALKTTIQEPGWHLTYIQSDDDARLPYRSIIPQLAPGNPPYHNAILDKNGGWAKRRLDQINAVTIHHTLSDSPYATATYYVKKIDKDASGRPTIPYTFWISQTGEILQCVPLEFAVWHDQTGGINYHLSVGMAGTLHLYPPSLQQLHATAKLCVWCIKSGMFPQIRSIDQITGHMDWFKDKQGKPLTVCPGWHSAKSGNWKIKLYNTILEMLRE